MIEDSQGQSLKADMVVFFTEEVGILHDHVSKGRDDNPKRTAVHRF